MKYLDIISILIPIILSIITFLYYWPLVIEYFDIKKSISYKNNNKHTFFILLILITFSTCLSVLILSNVEVILSWIGQFIVLIVFYNSINLKFNSIKRYVKGENIDYEINQSNNVLLEEIYVNSSQINESLSEEIKMSTSDIIKSSEQFKDFLIDEINFNSNKIVSHSIEIHKDLSTSVDQILSNNSEFKSSVDVLITEYEKVYINNSIQFIKNITEENFELLLKENLIELKDDNYILFKNLVIQKIEPNRMIDIIVPYKYKNTKNQIDKEKLFTFLNLFFDLENISNTDFKNEYKLSKQNYFNKYFLLNGVANKFERVDFTGRYN